MTDLGYDFQDFEKMPIRSLGRDSRINLSLLLNPEQLLASDSGQARDFRGIAELLGFTYAQIQNFKRSSDPLSALLDSYSSLPAGRDSTVMDLLAMLQQIGRFDVIDDLLPSLRDDLSAFHRRTSSSLSCAEAKHTTACDESQILSLNDVITGEKTFYDAYVCYADADLHFVREMDAFLQNSGVTLFIRERDLLAGALHYDVFTQLIQSRCHRMLVVLSPDFLQCSECDFQTRFATSLGVDQRMRKLIPVVYKPCESLPATLNMLTKIDFSRGDRIWSWRKLVLSIKGSDYGLSGSFIPQCNLQTSQTAVVVQENDSDAKLVDLSEEGEVVASAPVLTPSAEIETEAVMNPYAQSSKLSNLFKSMKERLKAGKTAAGQKSDSSFHLIQKNDAID